MTDRTTIERIPANAGRGALGILSFILIIAGAGLLWGAAAACLCVGVALLVMTTLDEVVERITRTARG